MARLEHVVLVGVSAPTTTHLPRHYLNPDPGNRHTRHLYPLRPPRRKLQHHSPHALRLHFLLQSPRGHPSHHSRLCVPRVAGLRLQRRRCSRLRSREAGYPCVEAVDRCRRRCGRAEIHPLRVRRRYLRREGLSHAWSSQKAIILDHLAKLAEDGKIEWTAIKTGPFLDWGQYSPAFY
jgi:hypothetical protein